MRNLDTLNQTCPVMRYTCFVCGEVTALPHHCVPETLPARAWLHVGLWLVGVVTVGYGGLRCALAVIQWLGGGA